MAVTALLKAGVKQDCIFHSGNLGRDDIKNVSLSELDLSKAQLETLLAGLKLNDWLSSSHLMLVKVALQNQFGRCGFRAGL